MSASLKAHGLTLLGFVGLLTVDILGKLSAHGAVLGGVGLGALGLSSVVTAFRTEGGPLLDIEKALAPMLAAAVRTEMASARVAFEGWLRNHVGGELTTAREAFTRYLDALAPPTPVTEPAAPVSPSSEKVA